MSVIKELRKTAEQIEHTSTLILNKTKDWQVLEQYLNNRLSEDKLSEKQKEKLERYQFMYSQLASHKYSETDVVNQTKNFFNISLVQAYEDLNSTKELFSSIININKAFEFSILLSACKRYARKCEEIGDFKAAASIAKTMVLLVREVEAIEKDKPQEFEGFKLEPVFDPSLIGAPVITKKDMADLVKRINEKRGRNLKFDDADFEDVE